MITPETIITDELGEINTLPPSSNALIDLLAKVIKTPVLTGPPTPEKTWAYAYQMGMKDLVDGLVMLREELVDES